MNRVRPVHVDGVLYFSIAVLLALNTTFSSDDAYKYVNPYVIFFGKAIT